MTRTLGNAPEYLYEPSACNAALLDRPVWPDFQDVDPGGIEPVAIRDMTRTYSGYIAGCGDQIRAARMNANVTQEDLAMAVGTGQAQISVYELNHYSIPSRTALLIADALGITADELLHGAGEAAVAD